MIILYQLENKQTAHLRLMQFIGDCGLLKRVWKHTRTSTLYVQYPCTHKPQHTYVCTMCVCVCVMCVCSVVVCDSEGSSNEDHRPAV